jgi:hypothetical protein
MRIAAVVLTAALTFTLAALRDALPATAEPSAEDLFRQFDLFGAWAGDCARPATADNPHVTIKMTSAGQVLEEHDLGADYEANRYDMKSATRLSASRLSVTAIFQPGAKNEERQTLVFLIRDGTRRTMFNQPEGGAVRVKDGIALAHHVKTPVLRKCG